MTVQEAIQSGKPFKRKGFGCWYTVDENSNLVAENKVDRYRLDADDVLATDWEIKIQPIVITAYMRSNAPLEGVTLTGIKLPNGEPYLPVNRHVKLTIEVVE